MTEPAPATPRFPRRRVLLGGMALVLGLAVAGVLFGVFEREPAIPVRVKILRFENEFGIPSFAVIKISNLSAKQGQVLSMGELQAQEKKDYPGFPANMLAWYPDRVHLGPPFVCLNANEEIKGTVPLPNEGYVGRVAVGCVVEPMKLPVVLHQVRELWWRASPRKTKIVWAVCDQEIQCPRVRPDGTVEPPRLLP